MTYVLREDRDQPEGEQSRFTVGTLTARDRMKVTDEAMELNISVAGAGTRAKVGIGSQHYELVRRGVVGWSNIVDDKGRPFPAKRVRQEGDLVLDDDSMDGIAPWIPELAEAVRQFNHLSGPAEGSSGGESVEDDGEGNSGSGGRSASESASGCSSSAGTERRTITTPAE